MKPMKRIKFHFKCSISTKASSVKISTGWKKESWKKNKRFCSILFVTNGLAPLVKQQKERNQFSKMKNYLVPCSFQLLLFFLCVLVGSNSMDRWKKFLFFIFPFFFVIDESFPSACLLFSPNEKVIFAKCLSIFRYKINVFQP